MAVEGQEFVLREGDYLLLPARLEHWGTGPVSEGQSHFWCHFSMKDTDDALLLPLFGTMRAPEKYTLLFRQLIDAEYEKYVSDTSRQVICDAYLSVILHELINEQAWKCGSMESAYADEGKRRKLVMAVQEWIRLNLSSSLTPSTIAAHFGYHTDYLTHLFRVETGRTLGEYVNRARIERSKKYLLNTDMKIAQVADMSGFSDEKYFMRIFRRFEGVTPSEFRRAYVHLHINNE